jgi:hypothetical protein
LLLLGRVETIGGVSQGCATNCGIVGYKTPKQTSRTPARHLVTQQIGVEFF